MKLKIVFAIAGFVLLVGGKVSAQIYSYPERALTFSRIQAGGTARIRAMGGVQNSLGGDLSSAYYNPAGLGMYNKSEFSFTPGYSVFNSSATYLGNPTSASTGNFMIPNFGAAFHTDKNRTGLLGGTFAINFNRVNDFNNTFTYKGTNTDNSIIDYFIDQANGSDVSQFNSGGYNYNTPTGMAFNNYLIGPASELNSSYPTDQYFSYVPLQPIIQSETIKTSGAQNQLSFSYGVNINDKIFVGGGLGYSTISYKTSVTYNETYTMDPVKTMQLQENLDVSGNGINLSLGVIARPMDQLQIGVSMATPTSYQISENYSASMSTNWNNYYYATNTPPKTLNAVSDQTDLVNYNYTLNTPWRFTGGLTYFLQKKGFISADFEYLSYGSSKYSGDSAFDQDNKDIGDLYKSVLNIRVGGEYRLKDYRFRGGFNLMPDPFKSSPNGVDRTITSYSLGAGYRQTKYYIDFAAILQLGNTTHSPYNNSPLVTLKNQATTFMVTVGFPF